jgi:hypothetical protein
MQAERTHVTDLSDEIGTYNRLLPKLLAQQGKFVLIKGSEQAGTFDSYQDALAAGYAKFQLQPFLVKQIVPAERVSYFTRDLTSCHP